MPSDESIARPSLRPPDQVMRLARLGSFHQTRLSFLRALLRTIDRAGWRFERPRFDVDGRGVGVAVYTARSEHHTYSLVAFGHDLAPEMRTDRVIAEAWDATFALYNGVPDEAEIARLEANVPRQEAGRYLASDLVLARANRSVRLFDRVVTALAEGRQPDGAEIEATGYLMRTTAVYGNGKFGIADRCRFADRPGLGGPFRAEMLTVWLIRAFTVDLVEHMARLRAPERAVRLAPTLRRRLGIGNATGLGMAPFLVRHPTLIDRWIAARETALARVRALLAAGPREVEIFRRCLARSEALIAAWQTDDPVQAPRIAELQRDLARLSRHVAVGALQGRAPWDTLYLWGERELSLEGQEYLVTLLIEPHGAPVDDLAETMAADEVAEHGIDGAVSTTGLLAQIRESYSWALSTNYTEPANQARFWYVSEEKLEPRLGARHEEEGADKEQPLATARDAKALAAALAEAPETSVAGFLLRHPEHRHTVRRVQIAARHPYGEIRDNLIGATVRPIDMLRCKLSFFGCTRFDPRSDLWLRITLFQGAPFPDDPTPWPDDWIYGGEASAS